MFILNGRRTALIYEGKLFHRLNVGQTGSQIRVVLVGCGIIKFLSERGPVEQSLSVGLS